MPKRWVAGVVVRHVFNKVRQLVGGVSALEVRCAIDVVFAVDLPVHVKHHNGVDTQRSAAPVSFSVACHRRITLARVRPGNSHKYMLGTWVTLAAMAKVPMVLGVGWRQGQINLIFGKYVL